MAHGWNMTDRKPHNDQNETPEDVATLYSWANLHGAKYRDFSASRALTRERARQRVQDAIAGEQEREDSAEEEARAAESARAAEAARQAELASQRVVQQAELNARRTAPQALEPHPFPQQGPQQGIQESAWQPPVQERPAPSLAPPAPSPRISQPEFRGYSPFNALRTTAPPTPARNAPREEPSSGFRNPAPSADPAQDLGRPAWLTQPRQEHVHQPVPQAPPDTLQGSRDRLTSRWFALKGVFDAPAPVHPEPQPSPVASRVPVTAVFSLAGGVGKTSLVATLARALSARGERLLLVDTSAFGLLPFYFGARDQRPGVLRTFSPPGAGGDAPIQTLSVDPDALEPENINPDAFSQEIYQQAKNANRVLVDVATASGTITRRMLRIAPVVLVPVIPDMSSVVSVGAIDAFFRQHPSPTGRQVQPFYLLNQFDHSLPLHLDVREVLREQLGDRLLPFVLRRTSAVSEALAEGMTVMDYAPNSALAEDFMSLAGWIKNVAAPVSSSYRGVRWSER
jgi:cellulose synthase operon protein YhjQ